LPLKINIGKNESIHRTKIQKNIKLLKNGKSKAKLINQNAKNRKITIEKRTG
jgi:hypothetical protein